MTKFPVEDKLPSTAINKELDAVQRALTFFKDNGLEALPWGDFQRKLQQTSRRFPKLFTEIRQNKPSITKQDLEKWIQRAEHSGKYDITYNHYHHPEHSYRDIEQLVVQINASADITKDIKSDSDLAQLFEFIHHGSFMSGHPVGKNGIGWLRIDYIADEDMIYVDEIQSDIINQTSAFKNFLTTNTPEEWFELLNDKLKKQIVERFGQESVRANWEGVRGQLRRMNMDPKKLDEARNKFVAMFEEWVESAIATVLDMARTHGITNVAIASSDAILRRDPSVGKDKIKMFYDRTARGFGFKERQIGVPELEGIKVWVRKASLKFQ